MHLSIQISIITFIISAVITTGIALERACEDRLLFLPEARISISSSVTSEENNNPSAILSRYLAVDAFRYGPLACSFNTYEIMNYGDKDSAYNFSSIYYNMEYINIRIDSSYGRISAFIDHRCENYVNQSIDETTTLRWYGYGIRWESPGMMTGYKDSRYGYSFFSDNDYLNFEVSARKPLSTRNYPYNYIADLLLRYDFYLTGNIIPFLSGEAELLYSGNRKWNYSAGTGVRFSRGGVDIIPYAEFSFLHRDDGETGIRYYEAGLKFESMLSDSDESIADNSMPDIPRFPHPELHMRGSYSKYIDDEYRNFRSDILFSLNLAKTKNFSIFCNTSLVHSSPQLGHNTGLYPRYIDYYYEGGISLNSSYNIIMEPLYRYTGYGEGNTDTGASYNHHMAAMRITTPGMKPGNVNSRILSRFTGSPAILLNTEAEMVTGWIPDNGRDKNCWLVEGTVREDLLNYKSAIPYLSINAKFENGITPGDKGTIREIKPECGIRFNRNLVLMLFYQYIRRSSDNHDYDINREYHLAGIRIDI